MSNYYLCDTCARGYVAYMDGVELTDMCHCVPRGADHSRLRNKLTMVDHHGVNGVRYEDPKTVCGDYEPREDA